MDVDDSAKKLALHLQALIGHSARDVVPICWISEDDSIQLLQNPFRSASDHAWGGARSIRVLEPLDRFGEDLGCEGWDPPIGVSHVGDYCIC